MSKAILRSIHAGERVNSDMATRDRGTFASAITRPHSALAIR
jgi:hypothetical protein